MSVSTWIAALRPVDLMSGAAALNPDAFTSWSSTQYESVAEPRDRLVRESIR